MERIARTREKRRSHSVSSESSVQSSLSQPSPPDPGVSVTPYPGYDFSQIPIHAPARGMMQTKLAINQSGDQYEQEAERISQQVSAAPAPLAASNAPLSIQHFTGTAGVQMDTAPASVAHALAGQSSPPDPTLRQDMEQRFGHDFSKVRIHADAQAAESARDVNALAYTVGQDIVFGAGQYAPETQEGRRLIAHELTHVVQQEGNTSLTTIVSPKRPGSDEAASPVEGVLYCDRDGGTTSKKSAMKSGGPSWEEALATMNAITTILPHVEEHGIILPTFGTPEEIAASPEAVLKNVPESYHDLVQEWHFIVHPVHTGPGSLTVSIYGTMREEHLDRAVAETQPLVNELATEGEASSTDPYLADYWKSVQALRDEIAEEVVVEVAEKAKTEQGLSFEGQSEAAKASTLTEKALDAVSLATTVVNQFNEEAIHEAVNEAEHLAKMKKFDELFREAARQAGELPHGGVLEAASKLSVAEAMVQIQGGLQGLSAILAVADPARREEMFRSRQDLFGQVAAVAQGVKLAIQFAAGATALVGAGTYAVAKMIGKESLATEVLAKGIPALEKLDVAISGVMVVHGILTLLDSDATGEEKEDAALEIGMGGATVLGNLLGAFEAGPASLSVAINFFTIKALAEAAVGFSVDLVKISLNQCYEYMRDEATSLNDDALKLVVALQLYTIEQDPYLKASLRTAIDTFRGILYREISEARRRATVEEGARDKDPASHKPLRKRFLPLANRSIESNIEMLEIAKEYVHIVIEAQMHAEDILNEEVNDIWEHHG